MSKYNRSTFSFRGFTIVELLVVIAVIAILVSITIIATDKWRDQISKDQVASDLKAGYSAMQGAAAFGSGFPTSLPATFVPTDGVTLVYKNGTSKYFCLEARHSSNTNDVYYINTTTAKNSPKSGTCPAVPSEPVGVPVISTVVVVSNQATVSWAPVSGATAYDVRYRRGSDAWVTSGRYSSPTASATIGGLTLSSSYTFQVRSLNNSAPSDWSGSVQRSTIPTPVISSYNDLGCVNSSGSYAWKSIRFYFNAATAQHTYQYKVVGSDTVIGGSSNGTSGTVTGTTSQWPANLSGSGTSVITGIGINGEESAPLTWTSPTYPPYEC